MTTKKKIKIAFIKFGGLCAGGTEKAFQTIAVNLPKKKFDIDFFYCDAAPYIGSDYKHPTTDPHRKKYLEDNGINLIKFNVGFKNVAIHTHDWVNTNFWELFDESKYDIVQTARAGHSEYPFTKIKKTPIVDLITLPGMAENKSNIYKSVHISEYQAESWVKAGGDRNVVQIIPLFDELIPLTDKSKNNYRSELGIANDVFVYGLHQREDNGIFSQVPLQCFKYIEDVVAKEQSKKVAFVLLGGGSNYQTQAQQFGLKNFHHLPSSGDPVVIDKFLNTLDVYAHGRADGETFSMSIAEAMYHGLPVVSHIAPATGHIETIGDGGLVADSLDTYVGEMSRLLTYSPYHLMKGQKAKERYDNHYSLAKNIEKWVAVYEQCLKDKFKEEILKTVENNSWLEEWMQE
jgi:glycosyltransferase involved in cell wall biosynthesis